ncbi:MAG: ABC transporter permease [Desulfobacula sp.]|jgi:lipopolysaccharide transport system permease protein|nr:ABC transporter permease [Desulfobacula sp.]
MLETTKDIWKNHEALGSQFYVNLKTTVTNTRLGLLWWILDPLFFMAIYYFVVSIVFERGGPNYHLFALCGIVTWQSFARSVNLCTNSLVRSAGLIKQASLPIFFYVIISSIVQAFFYTIGLMIITIWNNQVIGTQTPAIFILVFLMVLMTSSLGLFLSIFHAYVRDTGKIVAYILRFGFYISPVLYSPDRIYGLESIPNYFKILYSLNPMVHIITAVRDLLFYGKMFDLYPILIIFIVTMGTLQLGLMFFRRVSPYVPKVI